MSEPELNLALSPPECEICQHNDCIDLEAYYCTRCNHPLANDWRDREGVMYLNMAEKDLIRKNEILFKEIRRDLHPAVRAMIGIVIGTIFGMVLNIFIDMSMTTVYCAIIGAFIGIINGLHKNDRGPSRQDL